MATYKVLQDIEAEDKLFGPFTLKQFIFGAITIGLGFIQFTIITSGAPGFLKLPVVFVFLLPMLVFGFMAAPIGQDQPNDIWLLARLRFLFKPHTRIWNQDGISQLVTITAPKKDVHVYSDGLSQTEVNSRLHALASTMDSRGWAVKNVATNLYSQPGYLSPGAASSDRLVDPSEFPQEVPNDYVDASDDMLDTANNPIAQHLDQMVQASTQSHRKQAVSSMKDDPASKQTPQNYWFMNQPQPQQTSAPPDYATFSGQQVVAPGKDDAHPAANESTEEKKLGEKLAAEHNESLSHIKDHMRTIQPLHDRDGKIVPQQPPPPAQNNSQDEPQANHAPSNTAMLGLARNNDLNVETIARQAKRMSDGDDEVVINLHG